MNLAPAEKNDEWKPKEETAGTGQAEMFRITVAKEYFEAEQYAKLAARPTTLPAELLGDLTKKIIKVHGGDCLPW